MRGQTLQRDDLVPSGVCIARGRPNEPLNGFRLDARNGATRRRQPCDELTEVTAIGLPRRVDDLTAGVLEIPRDGFGQRELRPPHACVLVWSWKGARWAHGLTVHTSALTRRESRSVMRRAPLRARPSQDG